jgi:superfamily II DNA or RNA helicase
MMKNIPNLRAWQSEALLLWQQERFHGCIEVATGGGKTTFALAAFRHLITLKPNLRLVVVVPTIALQDQWYLAFEEDLGVKEEDIKVLSSNDLDPSSLVNIVIINTARKLNGLASGSEDIFLVVDECHRAGSPENSLSLIRNTYASLGLSATPFREFDDGFKSFIEPVLGPVFFSYTLSDAIADGILSNLEVTNIKIPLLPSEDSEYNSLTSAIGRAYGNDSEQHIIDALLRKRARLYNNAFYRIPTVVSIMENNRKRRTIIFFESIQAAEEAKDLLESHGHKVISYHSKISEIIRRSNLRLFRRGLFDILIACRALDEGFNVPEAQLAIIAAGTSSKRQRIQRMGRVLRSMAGKDSAQVITLYATDVEEARLVIEENNFSSQIMISWQKVQHER